MMDMLRFRLRCTASDIRMLMYWQVKGFPFKRRCWQCCGDGKYLTEVGARYGDEPDECDTCKGTGLIKREWRKR
jgi:hypothetical protein